MPKQSSLLVALAGFLAIGLFTATVHAQDNGETTDSASSTSTATMENGSSEHVARAVFTSEIQATSEQFARRRYKEWTQEESTLSTYRCL